VGGGVGGEGFGKGFVGGVETVRDSVIKFLDLRVMQGIDEHDEVVEDQSPWELE
jgi:hypothetical protein